MIHAVSLMRRLIVQMSNKAIKNDRLVLFKYNSIFPISSIAWPFPEKERITLL